MTGPERVAVVGDSLAGRSFARSLRARGHTGPITVIGDDPDAPYDRPPLSKAFLTGATTEAELSLIEPDEDLALHTVRARAVGLDPARAAVRLADGREIVADVVVVATGAHARRLPAALDHPDIRTLRTLDDARGLRAALTGARRLVVIGAGFIGCELAATAHGLGVQTTLIDIGPTVLHAALGAQAGEWIGELHRARGVRLRCGVAVTGVDRDGDGCLSVRFADGTTETGDVGVTAIGSVPASGWLIRAGLEFDVSGAIVTDPAGRTSTPSVFAIGDIAAPRHAGHRCEHWTAAVEQADRAAAAVLGQELPAAAAPYFWSDQFGLRLQFAGERGASDVPVVVDGSLAEESFAVEWRNGDAPTAVLAVDRPRTFGRLRRSLRTPAPPATAVH